MPLSTQRRWKLRDYFSRKRDTKTNPYPNGASFDSCVCVVTHHLMSVAAGAANRQTSSIWLLSTLLKTCVLHKRMYLQQGFSLVCPGHSGCVSNTPSHRSQSEMHIYIIFKPALAAKPAHSQLEEMLEMVVSGAAVFA